MFRQLSTQILRSTKSRALSTAAEVPATQSGVSKFEEIWKKMVPNMDPPKTPSSYMKPRPPTPSTIPSKLKVNLALPYSSMLSSKEVCLFPSFLLFDHFGIKFHALFGINVI